MYKKRETLAHMILNFSNMINRRTKLGLQNFVIFGKSNEEDKFAKRSEFMDKII